MSSFKTKKIATKAPIFAKPQKEQDSSVWISGTEIETQKWNQTKSSYWKRVIFWIFLVLVISGWVFAGKKAFESNSQNGSESFKPPLVD